MRDLVGVATGHLVPVLHIAPLGLVHEIALVRGIVVVLVGHVLIVE
ncbi:hypothetical protein QDR37_03565 [Amnibacterium sp. CER49]|nr:hypothetical protein [Amnibacterium sp. CER49]MDH2443018.1 hypothetical protein [Amnibacterium sp. CER49]